MISASTYANCNQTWHLSTSVQNVYTFFGLLFPPPICSFLSKSLLIYSFFFVILFSVTIPDIQSDLDASVLSFPRRVSVTSLPDALLFVEISLTIMASRAAYVFSVVQKDAQSVCCFHLLNSRPR